MTVRLEMHLPFYLHQIIFCEDVLFIYLERNTTEFTKYFVNSCQVKDRKIDKGHIIVSLHGSIENSMFLDQNEVILVTMFSGQSKPLLIVISAYCCALLTQLRSACS